MNFNSPADILHEYKKLLSLKNSLEGRLDEYADTIRSRDREIEMLQSMLSEASHYRSSTDSQVDELRVLQEEIAQLHSQGGFITPTEPPHPHTPEIAALQQQLDALNRHNAELQGQLTEAEHEITELRTELAGAAQRTVRIAELESLLAMTRDEVATLQRKVRGQ